MSSGFTFEKNLPHQRVGVESVLNVFAGSEVGVPSDPATRLLANPEILISEPQYYTNIKNTQEYNKIDHNKKNFDCSNVIDVSMETGTGKTYTYTKTMYDLNKSFGISKFIVVVPTLSIKAGTINFLKSDALKEHFRDDYERELKVYVVESQKSSSKNTKSYMPQAIRDFVEASNFNKKNLHILVINSGMVNSKSLAETYDTGLFGDQFDTPFGAIGAVKPFIIIDEPHKFPPGKRTWENIKRFGAQYIIRYGATFNDEYRNLVYRLTAVDAFNNDLVKGINAYIEEIVGEDTANLKLVKSTAKEATFELRALGVKKLFKLAKGESLSKAHSAIHDLYIESLNTSKVVLSNGIELEVGKGQSSINPYSYDQSLEDNMMLRAIKEHFNIEREFLTQKPRIKPLTLFFIDDIEGYRDGNKIAGSLKDKFEAWVLAEAKRLVATETDPYYKNYLEQTIADVGSCHGGYFSKDNSEKDEKIEQEITEILHDKELLLSLDNPRRFIFSKWTLREGWDNPNVFQICKLRSSGSTTSKLQEVGRGLRLPVNEYMCRVKDRTFSLNYYVDFTEKDFVDTLIKEVNKTSFTEESPSKLTQELLDKIHSKYPDLDELDILLQLKKSGVIDGNKNFIGADAFSKVRDSFPKAFPATLSPGKIKIAGDGKKRTPMRVGKFAELKELWEIINQKAVLEYKISDEHEFLSRFTEFLLEETFSINKTSVQTRIEKIFVHNGTAMSKEIHTGSDDLAKISTMTYQEFLEILSRESFIKMSTLHQAFAAAKDTFDITEYLNIQTIRRVKSGFKQYLLNNAFTKFALGYNVISNTFYPTKFTDDAGHPLPEVLSSDLGLNQDDYAVPLDSYLFEKVFYDSNLEKENIIQGEIDNDILAVTVFTKIPKNSIKIPVAGGYTYSPDFAYVVKTAKNEYLNFIIETKNVEGKDALRKEEERKIEHAMQLFKQISKDVKIEFKTQFSNDTIYKLIKSHVES